MVVCVNLPPVIVLLRNRFSNDPSPVLRVDFSYCFLHIMPFYSCYWLLCFPVKLCLYNVRNALDKVYLYPSFLCYV